MNKNAIKFLLVASLAIVFSNGCPRAVKEPKAASEKPPEQLSELDRVFSLAKGFAAGTNIADEVQTEFEKLDPEQLIELGEKREGSSDFGLYMATGPASEHSVPVLKKYLSSGVARGPAKDEIEGNALFKALLNPVRPAEDDKEFLDESINAVLATYPNEINRLKKEDGSFDAGAFNNIAEIVDDATAKLIIERLDKSYFNAWLSWILDNPENKAAGQAAFKALYTKISADDQLKMRNALLNKIFADPDPATRLAKLSELIDDAEAWGLKDTLDKDEYILASTVPGSTIKGNLPGVFVRRAILESKLPKADRLQVFEKLRLAEDKIKNLLTPEVYEEVVTTEPEGGVSIKEVLKNELKKTNDEDFTNYYLALDKPNDVFVAAAKPEKEISNKKLEELFSRVIDNETKATELLDILDEKTEERFIHKLLKRNVDADGNLPRLLDNYLIMASEGKGADEEKELTFKTKEGEFPIQIFVKNKEGDALQKQLVFNRLLENDNIAVKELSNDDLKNQVALDYARKAPGENGRENFKKLYAKMPPEKQAFMHSELLKLAEKDGISAVKILVNELADAKEDSWGINAGLDKAEFTIDVAGKPVKGSLSEVLAKMANNEDDYHRLRSNIKAIHASLGAKFDTEANALLEILKAKLAPKKKQFAPYFLGLEKPADVLLAAERPETDVNNDVILELYQLVIGNLDALAVILSEEISKDPKENYFIHSLLKRSADKNTYAILSKFFASISAGKSDAERLQLLKKNAAKELPLAIFFKARRELPPGFADNLINKGLMMARLLRQADASTFEGVTAQDLAAQGPWLINDPEDFRKISAFFPEQNSDKRIALRSTLLGQVASKPKLLAKFITEVTTKDPNVWDLSSTVATDIYRILKSPVPAGDPKYHEGILIYVLVMMAIDANNEEAYQKLAIYAQLIKNNLGEANYKKLITENNYDGKSIQTLLKSALDSNAIFANSYLAIGSPADIYEAVKLTDVSNELIRSLYDSIIGDDDNLAQDLAKLGKANEDKFIHELLKRPADNNTEFVLNKFLTAIYNAAEKKKSGQGKVAEKAQLNIPGAGGKYPLGIMLNSTRENDNPLSKGNMIARLLKYDDGEKALASVTVPDLESQTWFVTSKENGREAFKKIYSNPKINTDENKLAALRNALFAGANNDPNNPSRINELVNEIAGTEDIWGLRAKIISDNYKLPSLYTPKDKVYEGTLPLVLTQDAIEKATKEGPTYFNKFLRPNTEAIKKAVQPTETDADKGKYVEFANKLVDGHSAVSRLKAYLSALKEPYPGLLEYILQLDTAEPGFNEDLIFAAAKNKPWTNVFDNSTLKWLYGQAIDEAAAVKLGEINKLDPTKDKFINLLADREIDKNLSAIFLDFLNKIQTTQGVMAASGQIGLINSKDKNVLQQLLNRGTRRDDDKEKNPMIKKSVDLATSDTFDNLEKGELVAMLQAVKGTATDEELFAITKRIPDDKVDALAAWCLARIKTGKVSKPYEDNFDDSKVLDTCRKSYENSKDKTKLLNAFVKNAYDIGVAGDGGQNAGVQGGMARVAKLIKIDMVPKEAIVSFTFDPFAKFSLTNPLSSSLLFALLTETKPEIIQQVSELISALRSKFDDEKAWQGYNNSKENPDNKSNFEQLKYVIDSHAPGKFNDEELSKMAEEWLQYAIPK